MSVNKALIIGRLGNDPVVRQSGNGKYVCNFSVATSDKYTTKAGEKKENTEWHNVVVWGPSAEACGKFLKKGRSVFVEGRMQHREYEKDGVKRTTTEINASKVEFLDKAGKDSGVIQADPKYTVDEIPF